MSTQHQQQQQNKNQPQPWKPDTRTRFIVLSDAKFEARARQYVWDKYGRDIIDAQTGKRKPVRIDTEIADARRLGEDSTIVVLYFDGDAPIKDEDGKFRARRLGKKMNGNRIEEPELPQVLETKPIKCRDLWVDGADNDDGVDPKALVRAMSTAAHPCRAQLVDRDGGCQITVRGA